MSSRVLITLFLLITLLATTNAIAMDRVDYNTAASFVGFSHSSNAQLSSRFYFDLEYRPQNSYSWVLPADKTKAAISIIPIRDSRVSDWGGVAPLTPTIVSSGLTISSLPVSNALVEGSIYTVDTLSVITPQQPSIVFTVDHGSVRPSNTAQDFFITMYGCLSTPNNPISDPLQCTNDRVEVMYSVYYSVPPTSTTITDANTLFHAVTPTIPSDGSFVCQMRQLDALSHIGQHIGTDNVVSGAKMTCGLSFVHARHYPTTRYFIRLDVVQAGSYDDSPYSYGYRSPKIIATHLFSQATISAGNSTGDFYFLRHSDDPTQLSPFIPGEKYKIRISLQPQDIALYSNLQLLTYTQYYTTSNLFYIPWYFNPYNPNPTGDVYAPEPNALHHTFSIMSHCDLTQLCYTPTKAPEFCDPLTFINFSNFQCDCSHVFGGALCEYSWVPNQCLQAEQNGYSGFQCFIRWTSQHVRDRDWQVNPFLATACSAIVPPATTECIQDDTWVACEQSIPEREITASSPLSSYTTFTLGSRIQCAPYTPFPNSTRSIEYRVYVIWDTTQTDRNPIGSDVNVYSQLVSVDPSDPSAIIFPLVDKDWFIVPSALANKNIDITAARFYISMRPAQDLSEYFSPIYSISSACTYYNSICLNQKNYLQCENLPLSPFIPLYNDFNEKNCLCRDGYILEAIMETDENGIEHQVGEECVVFSVAKDCLGGFITSEPGGCCETHPHIAEVAAVCRQLGGVPEIAMIQLASVNDLNVNRNEHAILSPGDEVTIRWTTVGNISSWDNSDSLYGSLHLFAFNTVSEYGTPPPENDKDGIILDANIDLDLINTVNDRYLYTEIFNNEHNNLFAKFDPNAALFNTTHQTYAPFFLQHVKLSDGEAKFTLPANLKMVYNARLVLSFMASYTNHRNPSQENGPAYIPHNHWVIASSSDIIIHTHPSCMDLSIIEPTNSNPLQTLRGINQCAAGGKCNLHSGTCECTAQYDTFVLTPTTPHLCQIDVCSRFLTCLNGQCDPQSLQCRCYEGWAGTLCDIPLACNAEWPVDPLGFILEGCNINDGNCDIESPTGSSPTTDNPPENYSTCSTTNHGYIEQSWRTDECLTNTCRCLENYGGPKCDTCANIKCTHGTQPDLSTCDKCLCNRYTHGPLCSCHKLPMIISVFYPLVDLTDIAAAQTSSDIDSAAFQYTNINNQMLWLTINTIREYSSRGGDTNGGSKKILIAEHTTPFEASEYVYTITNQYSILTEQIHEALKQELSLEDLYNINSLNVTVLEYTNGQFQIKSLTISAYLLDDCETQSSAISPSAKPTYRSQLSIISFIKAVQNGTAKTTNTWGKYFDYRYLYNIASDTLNSMNKQLYPRITLEQYHSNFVKSHYYKTKTGVLVDTMDSSNMNNFRIHALLPSASASTAPKIKIVKDLSADPNMDIYEYTVITNSPLMMVQFDSTFYTCMETVSVPDGSGYLDTVRLNMGCFHKFAGYEPLESYTANARNIAIHIAVIFAVITTLALIV